MIIHFTQDHHFTSFNFPSLHFTSLHCTAFHCTSHPFFHVPAILDVSSPPFKNPSRLLTLSLNFFYNDIPEAQNVCRLGPYNDAAILWLQDTVRVYMTYCFPWQTLCSVLGLVCAVLNVDVFCSSLVSCLPGMLLRYFLYDSEIFPVIPNSTDILILLLVLHST